MIKKISLITLFVLFAGLLIYGAINRTAASSQKTARAEANGSGAGQIASSSEHDRLGLGSQGQNQQQQSQGQNANEVGQGQQRQGQGRSANEASQEFQAQGAEQRGQGNGQGRLAQNASQASTIEQLTISGTVVQAPDLGVDIILETDDGQLSIGTGPGYLAEQGFLIQEGDSLTIAGFWEEDLFKPLKITRDADGETIVLRDEWGRPMWSGARRSGRNGQATQDGL